MTKAHRTPTAIGTHIKSLPSAASDLGFTEFRGSFPFGLESGSIVAIGIVGFVVVSVWVFVDSVDLVVVGFGLRIEGVVACVVSLIVLDVVDELEVLLGFVVVVPVVLVVVVSLAGGGEGVGAAVIGGASVGRLVVGSVVISVGVVVGIVVVERTVL